MQNDKANSAHARKTQVRESEKTGGRKEKRGKRKGERKRLNGIYKKTVEVKELTTQKRQKKEEDEILR